MEQHKCNLNDAGIIELRSRLLNLRTEVICDREDVLSTKGLTSGFPLDCIREIINNVDKNFGMETLIECTSLLAQDNYDPVIEIFQDILTQPQFILESLLNNSDNLNENDYTNLDSDTDENGDKYDEDVHSSDSDLNLKYRFLNISSSDEGEI